MSPFPLFGALYGKAKRRTSSLLSIAHFDGAFNEKWPEFGGFFVLSDGCGRAAFVDLKYLSRVNLSKRLLSLDLDCWLPQPLVRRCRCSLERHIPALSLFARTA